MGDFKDLANQSQISIWQNKTGQIKSCIQYHLQQLLVFVTDDVRHRRIPADTPTVNDPVDATRVLCGALTLPPLAVMVGQYMFGSVRSNTQRAILVTWMFYFVALNVFIILLLETVTRKISLLFHSCPSVHLSKSVCGWLNHVQNNNSHNDSTVSNTCTIN